jgi:RES domain
MSSSIWTPAELSSNARPAAGRCWRAVEAQHHVSTAKVTDSAREQHRLEELIEASKSKIPPECAHLHYLLSTPFRYGARYPQGSRFRRPGFTPGVFYSSETPATAIAELAFWRLLFFADSPDTPWPTNPGEYTAFAVEYFARAIDLTVAPFDRHRVRWIHPTDYLACQELADGVRTPGIEVIRYESARDPGRGLNLAILSCRAFARSEEVGRQTWRIHLSASGCRAFCEMPKIALDFDRSAFSRDPRIATIRWDR